MITVAVGGILILLALVGLAVGLTLGLVRGWRPLVVTLVGVTLALSALGGGMVVVGVRAIITQQEAATKMKVLAAKRNNSDETTVKSLGDAVTFESGERINVLSIRRTAGRHGTRYPVVATVVVENPTKKTLAFSEQEFQLYDDWGPARFDERTYAGIPAKLAPGAKRRLTLYFNAVASKGYAVDYGDIEWQ